ncbi:hypothetical protein GUJ93_ZPchr0006g43319 [Zizania palustris]|uniref:Uncharacterized protein n=1 Tax=Zizania palustris TaxID=103762 RepID=A0A8J5T7M9_ZIZPA|nr:hypothetical protein GUJ93_ZPchr0006g43319 [Zizania palustris]
MVSFPLSDHSPTVRINSGDELPCLSAIGAAPRLRLAYGGEMPSHGPDDDEDAPFSLVVAVPVGTGAVDFDAISRRLVAAAGVEKAPSRPGVSEQGRRLAAAASRPESEDNGAVSGEVTAS